MSECKYKQGMHCKTIKTFLELLRTLCDGYYYTFQKVSGVYYPHFKITSKLKKSDSTLQIGELGITGFPEAHEYASGFIYVFVSKCH